LREKPNRIRKSLTVKARLFCGKPIFFYVSGILHDDRADAVADMLASICTFLEAVEDVVPAQLVMGIKRAHCDAAHSSYVKLVTLLFNIVTFDNKRTDLLGLFEVAEFAHYGAQKITSANEILGIFNSGSFDSLDIVDIHLLENLFHNIENVVKLVAHHIKIFSVNGGYKGFSQRFAHFVLLLVSAVFNGMHLIKHFFKLICIVIFKAENKILCRLLGK